MTAEDQVIEQIIKSLHDHPLQDIRSSIKERPFAAFILAVCFIDQLGGYRYNISKNRKRWAAIIDDYMYPGKGKELFITFRSDLIHNYSLKAFNVLTAETQTDQHPENTLSLPTFFTDVEAAFAKISLEFRTANSEARKNALAWNKRYPVQ